MQTINSINELKGGDKWGQQLTDHSRLSCSFFRNSWMRPQAWDCSNGTSSLSSLLSSFLSRSSLLSLSSLLSRSSFSSSLSLRCGLSRGVLVLRALGCSCSSLSAICVLRCSMNSAWSCTRDRQLRLRMPILKRRASSGVMNWRRARCSRGSNWLQPQHSPISKVEQYSRLTARAGSAGLANSMRYSYLFCAPSAFDISTNTDRYFSRANPLPRGYTFSRHSTPLITRPSEQTMPVREEKPSSLQFQVVQSGTSSSRSALWSGRAGRAGGGSWEERAWTDSTSAAACLIRVSCVFFSISSQMLSRRCSSSARRCWLASWRASSSASWALAAASTRSVQAMQASSNIFLKRRQSSQRVSVRARSAALRRVSCASLRSKRGNSSKTRFLMRSQTSRQETKRWPWWAPESSAQSAHSGWSHSTQKYATANWCDPHSSRYSPRRPCPYARRIRSATDSASPTTAAACRNSSSRTRPPHPGHSCGEEIRRRRHRLQKPRAQRGQSRGSSASLPQWQHSTQGERSSPARASTQLYCILRSISLPACPFPSSTHPCLPSSHPFPSHPIPGSMAGIKRAGWCVLWLPPGRPAGRGCGVP